jgi:XTP/dITP diphosphohydrolase
MQLCFATNNHHKLEEVMAVLGKEFSILSLKDIGCEEEIPETQNTIPGNARQKSDYVWDHYKISCFADDTGLEVKALDGAPGVYSARYAGPQRNSVDNMNLLLQNLQGNENREAQFRTVIALRMPKGEWIFEGIIKGSIMNSPRGSGGFGYDPIFLPQGSTLTLAEISMEEKNKISHRGQAVKLLADFLRRNHLYSA